jgi:sensor domain CHASE-containing protein
MSLNKKVLLVLFLVVAAYIGLAAGLQQLVVEPRFADLERHEALQDLRRCTSAIERETVHLDRFCRDWGYWDDTWRFARGENPEYEATNLQLSSFQSAGFNALYVLDGTGRVVWGRAYALSTGEPLTIDALPAGSWPPDHSLLRWSAEDPSNEAGTTDLLPSDQGLLLACARRILHGDLSGPPAGVLVIARRLSTALVADLVEQTHVTFETWLIDDPARPTDVQHAVRQLGRRDATLVEPIDAGRLHAYTLVRDRVGTPVLVLRAVVPRDISARGREVTDFALATIFLGALGLVAVLALFLRLVVVRPLSAITSSVVAVGRSGEPEPVCCAQRSDELGVLAREFGTATQKLAETRRRLEEQSFRAGMAELAEGVLHNIRNLLTPLAGELDVLRERVARLSPERVEEYRRELESGDPPTDRRRDLEAFLTLSSRAALALVVELRRDLESMATRLTELEGILKHNERYARAPRPLEPLGLVGLVEDAAALLSAEERARLTIETRPAPAEAATIRASRPVALQLLLELFHNASESVRRSGRAVGTVAVHAGAEYEHERRFVHVRVVDDGDGVEPGDLPRLFERGFTAGSRRGTGLGLHWCANAMNAMGGRVSAESAGRGRGATIHLWFPAATPSGLGASR